MKSSLELIAEFEKTFQVENWKVNDIHIWPAIRIPLMAAWERDLYYKDVNISSKRQLPYYRVFSELKQLILAIAAYKKKPTETYEVGVWGMDIERLLIQNKYYSPYGDALRDLEYENHLLCLDLTIMKNRVNHYPCADITLGYFVRKYVAKIRSILSIKTDIKAPLNEAILWCQDRELPSVGLTKNNLAFRYELLKLLKNYFKCIIKETQMRVCFKVSWYDDIGMALSWASKEMKILCFDLQHGIAGSTKSRAYSCWTRFPSEGYSLMPGGFWCWSEDDAKEINTWRTNSIKPIKVFVGGNVWNRAWKENKISIKLDFDDNVKSDNINILFTLQPLWSEEIPDLLIDLIKKSPKGWSWKIRCHPMNMANLSNIDRQLKKIRTSAEVDVIDTTKRFLPNLLMNIHIHITGWSAVLFDAKEFGVKTILCHPSAKVLYKDMIDSNETIYIDDTKQIITEIRSNIDAFKIEYKDKKYPLFKKFLQNNEV